MDWTFLATHADPIFAIGAVVLSAALLPAVFNDQKPPRSTCALTGSVLWLYALTFLSMGLLFSGALTGLSALLWTVLLVQQRRTA